MDKRVRTHRGQWLVVAAGAVLMSVPLAPAATNLYANKVLWQYTYEGNTLVFNPHAPTIGLWSGGAGLPPYTYRSTDGDIYTQTTTNNYTASWSLGPWDSHSNSTLEVRARVNLVEDGSATTYGFKVRMAAGVEPSAVRTYYLLLGDGWVDLWGGITKTVNAIALDTSVFRTYRVTVTNDGQAANLHIDGNPVPALSRTSGGNNPGSAKFLWGDHESTLGYGGSFSLDYIRWTQAGAFPPLPPQSTVLTIR